MLLTTHYLDEAEHLADRVGVLVAGRLVAEGTPEELIGGTGTTTCASTCRPATTAADLGATPSRPAPSIVDGHVEFTTTTPTADVHAVTGWALERGVELTGLSVDAAVAGGRLPEPRRRRRRWSTD